MAKQLVHLQEFEVSQGSEQKVLERQRKYLVYNDREVSAVQENRTAIFFALGEHSRHPKLFEKPFILRIHSYFQRYRKAILYTTLQEL